MEILPIIMGCTSQPRKQMEQCFLHMQKKNLANLSQNNKKWSKQQCKSVISWLSVVIPKYFCVVYDHAGKADPSKGYGNPKRKLGVTPHSSEIIKQQLF